VDSVVHSKTLIKVSYPLNASETFAFRENPLETFDFVEFSYAIKQKYQIRHVLTKLL